MERQAVKDLKFIASTMKGLITLADTLGDAADLSSLKAQLESNITDLKVTRSNLENEVRMLNDQCVKARADADATVAAAKQRADDMTAAAESTRAKAALVLTHAGEEAERMIAQAKIDAKAAFDAEIDAIKRRLYPTAANS